MKSSERTRSFTSRAAWYMSWTSDSICRCAPGRCTFTATAFPFGSVARCTCPIDAAATGSSSKSRKSRAIVLPSSSSITRSASANGNGRTSSWSGRSSAMMSGGTTSGRVDSSCPNLTNVGPSSSNTSRRCCPRADAPLSDAAASRASAERPGRRSVSLCAWSQ